MQENRSFDSYFGTYPGADGIPRGVCVPDPRGGCVRPYHDPRDRNVGGPHALKNAKRDIDGGLMDGFVRRGGRGHARLHGSERPGLRRGRRRPRGHGLQRRARHPELLGLRAQLRPAGPHVRAERLVEPAGAPADGQRLVGEVQGQGRSDELRRRAGPPGPAARLQGQPQEDDPRLRVDRYDVPPARASRELALLRDEGHRARLPRGRRDVVRGDPAGREDAGHLEPAAVLRHGARELAARQHHVRAQLLQGGQGREAAGGVVDRPGAEGQRAPAGARRRPGRRT